MTLLIDVAPAPEEEPYSALLESVSALGSALQELHQQAVAQYTPLVESIVRSRSQDIPYIERTLDHLLDFSSNEAGLILFKKLCRYYFSIDPVATASYIHLYRQLWDSDEERACND